MRPRTLALVVIVMLLAIVFAAVVFFSVPEVGAEPMGQLVISEVGWAGTQASSSDEYIELYNVVGAEIHMKDWYIVLTKEDGITSTINLPEVWVPINGTILLERTDDNTVSSRVADGIYKGSLSNSGIILMQLFAWDGVLQDGIGMPDGVWPAGDATTRASMQLRYQNDVWYTSSPGPEKDANGGVILGTPGSINVEAVQPNCEVVPYFGYDFWMQTEMYEDLSVSFDVHVSMMMGDGTEAIGILWWNSHAGYWWQHPLEFDEEVDDTCIDVFQNIMDGAENILNRRPSGVAQLLPGNMAPFLNAIHHFQASRPFESHLPIVTSPLMVVHQEVGQ